jgi:DNA repair protein RecO
MLLAFYLAEHVIAFAPEAEADDDLYRLLDTVCLALDAGVDRELATAYFEIWILRLAGITPSWRECAGCGEELVDAAWLSPDRDGLLCEGCWRGAGERLDGPALGLLRAISRTPLAKLPAPPPEAVRAVRAIAAAVRRGFLQEELRSYVVMEETLRGGLPP